MDEPTSEPAPGHHASSDAHVEPNGDATRVPDGEPQEAVHREEPHSEVHDRRIVRRRPRRTSTEYFDPSGVQEISHALREVLDNLSIPEVSSPSQLSRAATRGSDYVMRQLLSPRELLEVGLQDLGLTFENLRVTSSWTAVAAQPTVSSALNPVNWVRSLLARRHPHVRDIISGFEGCVRPGEMLLVLGRPGSGCSTLLRVLANQRRGYHKVEGNVSYDWITPSEVDKRFRGDVQYYPAEDLHLPSATVERVIFFAAKTRVAQGHIHGYEGNDYAGMVTEACITVMGLKGLKNTPIMNLSYSEKKRVSICEALVTRSRITCWDSDVEGSDETTCLENVQALRLATDLAHSTTLVTLYRCSEAIYDVFDKVCLIYEGKMIYFGATDLARQYFIEMGYQPGQRQTTIEFLLSLTDARHRRNLVQSCTVPRKPSEFVTYYNQSELRRNNWDTIATHLLDTMPRAGDTPRYPRVQRRNAYVISFFTQLNLVIHQRWQVVKFDLVYHLFYVAGAISEALMLGGSFNDLGDDTLQYFSRAGILFMTLILPTIFNLSEITLFVSQRNTILSHRQMAMYHPSIAALAMTIIDLPYIFIRMVPFTAIIYYFTSLGSDFTQYLSFYIINVVHSLAMRAYARALAAYLGNNTVAHGIGGTIFLVFSLYIGFEISSLGMVPALKWIWYINPMAYAFKAMIGIEFKGIDGPCPHPAPSGPGYENITSANQVCTLTGGWPADPNVEGRVYVHQYFGINVDDAWLNFGILVAIYVLLVTGFLLIAEYSASEPDKGRVVFLKQRPPPSLTRTIIPDPEKRGEDKDIDETETDPDLSGWSSPSIEEAMSSLYKMRHSLCWHNLTYTVQTPDSRRRILDGVSGFIQPGDMMLVMGEPNAGKSALVEVLTEKVDEGWISGERYMDWRRLPPDYRTQIGYCRRVDHHVPTISVLSSVKYSAMMRHPPNLGHDDAHSYAQICIRACGLEALEDAMLGTLKPEQSRRAAVAMELAAKPQFLFLSSPTSGLDPEGALAIMVMLRNLANHGQTILCCLHQPTAAVFQLFDKILVLQKLGKAAYFGDIGPHASTVTAYFEKKSGKQCRPNDNPAEFIVDQVSNVILDMDWHRIWRESEEFRILRRNMRNVIHQEYHQQPLPARRITHYVRPWWYQVWVLYLRGTFYFWRSPSYVLPKLLMNVFVGLLFGFSFYHTDNSLRGQRRKLFSIFSGLFVSLPLGYITLFPYFKIRAVYESRERANVSYCRSALTAGHLLAELQWSLVGSGLYFVCWFWAAGFSTSHAAYCYLVYAVLFPTYITTLAISVGSMSPNVSVASFIYSTVISIIFTFDDTMQPFSEMGWFLWLYYVTPFTYIMESMYGYTQHNLILQCSLEELSIIEPPSGLTCISYLAAYISREGGYIVNPDATSDCVYCPVKSSDQWMRECYNIRFSHRWRDVGILIGYISFHIFVTFFSSYLMGLWHRTHSTVRFQRFLHKLRIMNLKIPKFT